MRVKIYQDGSLGFILFTICKLYLNFLKVKVLNMESDAFPKPPFSTSLVTSLQFLITAVAHLTNVSLLFFLVVELVGLVAIWKFGIFLLT